MLARSGRSFPAVFPRGHLEVRLEGAVEVGEVLEAAARSDGKHRVVGGVERLGCHVQAVVVQVGDEALPGHLPEPAHEVAGAERADLRGVSNVKVFCRVGREPLQQGFQPLGVGGLGGLGGKVLPALRDEQGEKMQQLPLDDQLIAGQLGAVGVFHLPQAGGGFGVTQVVGAQPPGEGQAAALEREQILFGAEVFRAAQKLQIKDDVLIFHGAAGHLPQRVERAGRKDKDVAGAGGVGDGAHLDEPCAPLDEDQLHAVVPVERHLREIPGDGAGVNVEGKPHGTMLLGFLQRSLILHRCYLLMIGLYHTVRLFGKILPLLCGIIPFWHRGFVISKKTRREWQLCAELWKRCGMKPSMKHRSNTHWQCWQMVCLVKRWQSTPTFQLRKSGH